MTKEMRQISVNLVGIFTIVATLIWGTVWMGNYINDGDKLSQEKLAEINTRLASIDAKLEMVPRVERRIDELAAEVRRNTEARIRREGRGDNLPEYRKP